MRIWAVANQKGGVGKTTSVVTLAGLLADQGFDVLVLDLDPHGSLTSYFRYDPDSLQHSAYDLFQNDGKVDAELPGQLLLSTSHDRISLIPASTAMATLERKSVGSDGMGLVIARSLACLWDQFDYVIIDSPPVLGVLMVNALAACERLLVPVQTEFLAIKGLERMVRTLTMINRARKNKLEYYILPTFFDRRTQASVQSLRVIRQTYPEQVAQAVIPVDTKFRNASTQGIVPTALDPSTHGVRGYNMLMRWLMEKEKQPAADTAQRL
ncbi:ParA family protein [Motiliproteus sediminis]|uniref:ParA family protein n=1 Tax=Motiliproteus sediminis TaxID=1468178 RepID=UPI001AEFC39F